MIDHGKKNLLGIGINAVDYDAAVASIIQAAHSGRPYGVSALAVHGIMTGVMDRQHCYRLNQLDMIVPDGQPVRWALNWLYRLGLQDRVYGPNLTLRVCEAAAREALPIFLFGSDGATLSRLEKQLKERFPNLQIAGSQASLFRCLSATEKEELVNRIRASGARITLVGIGCPRQEVWAYEFREALSMPIMAVGAAFAFHSGQLAQAPEWMQKRGLEWAFRLYREPKRLWKRYAVTNPAYVSLLALQLCGLVTLTPDRGQQPTSEISYG